MSKSKQPTKKRKPTGRRKQYQQKPSSATSARTWWWIGGAAVALLLGAVALWFTVGPGKPASQTSTTPTATSTPVDAVAPAPTEPTESEDTLMPTNPADRKDMYSQPPEMQIDPSKTYVATISTAKGDIVVQLDASTAPLTVNNFVFLAQQGFYDNLTFHRVEADFVIQGGDPTASGAGGPGYTVPAEIDLPHIEGAIAMARQGDQVNPTRASSGSQFYITLAPTPFLDGAYTAFGQVTKGMDIVQSIAIGDVIETITITEE